jgi:hypothetical protein
VALAAHLSLAGDPDRLELKSRPLYFIRKEAKVFRGRLEVEVWCKFEHTLVRETRSCIGDRIGLGGEPDPTEGEIKAARECQKVAKEVQGRR